MNAFIGPLLFTELRLLTFTPRVAASALVGRDSRLWYVICTAFRFFTHTRESTGIHDSQTGKLKTFAGLLLLRNVRVLALKPRLATSALLERIRSLMYSIHAVPWPTAA